MKQKNYEEFIEDSEGLIEERSKIALNKLEKNSEYKEKYQIYSKLYDNLVKEIGKDAVEEFANSIYRLNEIENNYIYFQGFSDGILLKEFND